MTHCILEDFMSSKQFRFPGSCIHIFLCGLIVHATGVLNLNKIGFIEDKEPQDPRVFVCASYGLFDGIYQLSCLHLCDVLRTWVVGMSCTFCWLHFFLLCGLFRMAVVFNILCKSRNIGFKNKINLLYPCPSDLEKA